MARKQMTAEFYAVHAFNETEFDTFHDLLSAHTEGHAASISLDKKHDKSDADEKYQIRSIKSNSNGSVIMAVFGRCRFKENLEQASAQTEDSDVELLPGHGLVEKNHFLFFKHNNLVVYQKNGNGSGIGKLQRYITLLTKKSIALEAVLTEDSYAKLLNSGPLKKIEASIVAPPFSEIDEESTLHNAIKEFQSDNAKRIKISLSAYANSHLPSSLKESLANLARAGWAKVARATVKANPKANVDITDDAELKDQIIDLLLNKIKKVFEVEMDEKSKVSSQKIWSGLAKAKDESNNQLKAFFDPK